MTSAKAIIEEGRDAYHSLTAQARAAIHAGAYEDAVRLAFHSLQHVDAMMQFERKYGNKEFSSIESIDIILKYAPLLFDGDALLQLQILLRQQKRIEKNTSADITARAAAAQEWMRRAQRLWNCLEHDPGVQQDELAVILGGRQDEWHALAETWDRMGVIRRSADRRSYRLTLAFSLREVVRAKCPACGVVAKAPKAALLALVKCPKCRSPTLFVIIAPAQSGS